MVFCVTMEVGRRFRRDYYSEHLHTKAAKVVFWKRGDITSLFDDVTVVSFSTDGDFLWHRLFVFFGCSRARCVFDQCERYHDPSKDRFTV